MLTPTPQFWARLSKATGGAAYGLMFGLAASVMAVVQFLWRGPEWFDKAGFSLRSAIVFYLLGGIVAGAIAGALRDFARSPLRASLLGVVACVPLACAVWWALEQSRWPGTRSAVVFVLLFALACGAPFGWAIFNVKRRARLRSSSR